MKNSIKVLVLFAVSVALLFTACKKEDGSTKDGSLDDAIKNQEADITIKGEGKFDKVITKPLLKINGCNYIVEGTIEYQLDGTVVAVVDYGDGTCDNIATKTVDGITTEFELDGKEEGKGWEYDKVIVQPLIKLANCDYIVSGIIEFYKGTSWVATIDYGNGICDEWATKTWDGGSKVFSMKKDK
ncbi:MAG: hypothetical protein K8S00_02955 [Bacteroidales bacterium]|nr:hypothetical protein [Bacteroidales bacterium]